MKGLVSLIHRIKKGVEQMDYKYEWNNRLKVIQINNKDKAKHLEKYI